MSTQPILPDKLRTLLALANSGPVPQVNTPPQPIVPIPAMPMQRLALPAQPVQPAAPPQTTLPPVNPDVAATQAQTIADQNELQRLTNSGSGVQQITHHASSNQNLRIPRREIFVFLPIHF